MGHTCPPEEINNIYDPDTNFHDIFPDWESPPSSPTIIEDTGMDGGILGVNLRELAVMKDPTLKMDAPQIYVVPQGGKFVNYQWIVAESFSNSVINLNTYPPIRKVIIDPHMFIFVPITLTINGTANPFHPNTPLINYGVSDSLRALPFQSCLTSVTCQVNNNSVNLVPYQIYPDFLHFGMSAREQREIFSTFPNFLDRTQNYNDYINYPLNPLGGQSYKGNCHTPRGCFPIFIQSNTPTQAVVQFAVIEPLFFSPFLYGDTQGPGLTNINNFQWTFNIGDLSRMWSTANPYITSVSASIGAVNIPQGSAPAMLLKFITPHENDIIPPSMSYPYNNYQQFIQNVGTLAGGQTQSVTMPNVNLKTIPASIVVLARRRNADRTFATTDTFAAISNITIQWNNQPALLANAPQYRLWEIAYENGIDLSFQEWAGMEGVGNKVNGANNGIGLVGSILPLKFGKDIPLQKGEAAGLEGTWNITFDVTLTNLSSQAINFDLYMHVVTEGIFTVSQQNTEVRLGILTHEDVAALPSAPEIGINTMKELNGGNILGTIGSFARLGQKAMPYLSKGLDFLSGLGTPPDFEACPLCGKSGGCACHKEGGMLMSKPLLKRRRFENK